jgi:hypothetical protein
VALLGFSRGSFSSPGSRRWKQEVASGCPGSSTQVLLCPNEEDSVFALSPLALGCFLEVLNSTTFACVGDSNLLQKL